MRLSQSLELTIHALWYVAMQRPGKRVQVKEIARLQGVKLSYLAKIFQALGKTGLVTADRGKNGGYQLGRPAAEISMGDIVRALGENEPLLECLPARGCQATTGCPVELVFQRAQARMMEELDSTTLQDLVRRTQGHVTPEAIPWLGIS
jgi:Rrf2 family protein